MSSMTVSAWPSQLLTLLFFKRITEAAEIPDNLAVSRIPLPASSALLAFSTLFAGR